jgi:hypothetical protein
MKTRRVNGTGDSLDLQFHKRSATRYRDTLINLSIDPYDSQSFSPHRPHAIRSNHYIKSIAPEDPALKEIRNNAKRVGLDKLTMEEIDAEIASHRGEKKDKQSQPGRGQ